MREAIAALDREDPVVRYALNTRAEGAGLVVGGAGLALGGLGVALMEFLAGPSQPHGPEVLSVMAAAGVGVAIAGIPAMLSGPRFLRWYVERGPAPSDLARLRLLHTWRRELLQVRRDTALAGAGFLGAVGGVTALLWGIRDGRSGLRPGDAGYDATEGWTTLAFLAAAGATATQGLVHGLVLKQDLDQPHRLLSPPAAGVAALPVDGGVQVVGSFSLRF